MQRRDFLLRTAAVTAAALVAGPVSKLARASSVTPPDPGMSEAAWFAANRRYASLPFGRIAYVERGRGPAALFLHGAPLNGFQWRGAIKRLASLRRCIAPDFMGLGYSDIPKEQSLAPRAQAQMLAALLDSLGVTSVDIVASDSGTAVAQLFLWHYPQRVRTLLLTNGDVEVDSPPAGVKPAIDMARAGKLADVTATWLTDQASARSTFGAAVYRDPSTLTNASIAYYVTPLVSSPLRRSQYESYHLELATNPLVGVEAVLSRSPVPTRMVWGAKDTLFAVSDARYLERTAGQSRGVRLVPEGKLFFQEEYPEVIADEARRLWGA
nr:alpha/beta hydrolase [Luteibacter rhizovicinus]